MRKKLFTLFEILVWAVLLFVPLLFLSSILHPDLQVKKHYTMSCYDINGLIVGSPVNFIGYNVGYVRTIKVIGSRIELDIAITKDRFELPPCTIAKIEETGLGGSRSLEISPCNDPNKASGIYTTRAKKLSDILNDADSFSKSLVEGMGNMYTGLDAAIGDKDHEDFVKLQTKLVSTESSLKDMSRDLTTARVKAQKNLPTINQKMEQTLEFVSCIEINPQEIKDKTAKNQKAIEALGKNIDKHTPSQYNTMAKDLYWKTEYLKLLDKKKIYSDLTKFNQMLNSVQRVLYSIECNLGSESLQKRQQKMETIRKDSENLVNKEF